MQTQPNTYTIKRLLNGKYSLFDDKGEVIPLPIGKKLVTAFKGLYFYENGAIIARHGGKWYGFNADLTPIALLIKGELVTAFGWLEFSPDGKIIAVHGGKYYSFTADLTPIRLEIKRDARPVNAFTRLYCDAEQIEGEVKQVTAFDWLGFNDDGIQAKYGDKFYYFNLDGTLIA